MQLALPCIGRPEFYTAAEAGGRGRLPCLGETAFRLDWRRDAVSFFLPEASEIAMEKLETVWRFAVTGLAVWRLSRLFYKDAGTSQTCDATGEDSNAGRFWAGRAADLLCWASVWMSSQTAIWVACGFAGVFVSWLTLSGVSRLFARTERQSDEIAHLECRDGMRAHHG